MMTEPQKRAGRRVLIAVVVLAVLVGAEETWRGTYSSGQAKGEKLSDFALAPVPDKENFYKTPFLQKMAYGRAAKPAMSANSAWGCGFAGEWKKIDLAAVQKELRANASFVLKEGRLPAEDVVEAVGQIPEVHELREAAERKYSQCDPLLNSMDDTQWLNFVTLRELLQLFMVSGSAELELGHNEIAGKDASVVEQLSDGLRGDATLVSAMIHVVGSMCVLQVFWDGWQEQKWSDAQLVEFENYFASLNLVANVDRALHAETVFAEDSFRRSKSSNLKDTLVRTFGSVWVNMNLAAYRDIMRKDCYVCDDPTNGVLYPDICKKGMADAKRFTSSYSPFRFVTAMAMPNYERAFVNTAKTQAQVNEAAVVCALERFRHARGHYPASLEELAPVYFASVPKDPIDGKALHYRLDGDKFLLYSVGWDEKDDGGTQGTNDALGDWVWGK
jgi:hypothetical protein